MHFASLSLAPVEDLLADVAIADPSVIQVTVNRRGEVHTLHCPSGGTVWSLKQVIQGALAVEAREQRLHLEGRELSDTTVLNCYGLVVDLYETEEEVPPPPTKPRPAGPMSTIVKVVTPWGKSFHFRCRRGQNVRGIKRAIQWDSGISFRRQIIYLAGNELKDAKLLNRPEMLLTLELRDVPAQAICFGPSKSKSSRSLLCVADDNEGSLSRNPSGVSDVVDITELLSERRGGLKPEFMEPKHAW